jgi:alpha-methylacyl-CoA racemase
MGSPEHSHGEGPLAGVKVLEMAGLGPTPFGCMLLADLGADVIRVDRVADVTARTSSAADELIAGTDYLGRGRRRIAIELKHPEGVELVMALVERADVLVEGFRPGTMERLGLGPDSCRARNPRLVYARMTGWGQDGPLARAAGHDINYIALSGALSLTGASGEPVAPPGLVGDFGGGGMLLALGILAGLVERERSGQGQVIDAAIVDGSALLTTMLRFLSDRGAWAGGAGLNMLDGGAPFYGVYETSDGDHVALGAVEPAFQRELFARIGLAVGDQMSDPRRWPELRSAVAARIATRTRSEWQERLEGTDACFAPVLSLDEAPLHAHNRARKTFIDVDGDRQPAPGPRFDRTPAKSPRPASQPGADGAEVLGELGIQAPELMRLLSAGVVAAPGGHESRRTLSDGASVRSPAHRV